MPAKRLCYAIAATAALSVAALPARAADAAFTVTSPDVAQGGTIKAAQVLNGFGCTGGNVSPELDWHNAPAGTKSFAVTLYDPDAPTGSGWWHWVVVDIPASSTMLPEGWGKPGAAGGRQTRTDFGTNAYGGPCPPPGTPHRYIFTVYALDIAKVPVPDDASGAMVGFNLGAHALAKTVLNTSYGR